METPSFFDRLNGWMRTSITLKLFTIGFLILLLMIPSNMIEQLIYERQTLRDEATVEVSAKWGAAQTITGPIISVPYTETYKDEYNHQQTRTAYAHFLPDQLSINGNLQPEQRHRGIYVVVLYKSTLRITGNFDALKKVEPTGAQSALRWNEATINLGISDMTGIRENIFIQQNAERTEASPGCASNDLMEAGIHVPLRTSITDNCQFSIDIKLNGSSEINFVPFGKETKVNLQSAWGNPSFQGSFLPENRSITPQGFTADWRILQLNRNYAQQGLGSFINNTAPFGVRLLIPVDEYQKTTRSTKYGIMFIIITFLSFFFIEILNRRRIHPIQYLLVGFAVVLFYVLLLSISEHLNFDASYWISCTAILTLITGYAYFVFSNIKLTAIFAGILLLLYVFFYSLLQLQDYSLLLGSIGLFIILATVMYLTRKIDWYNWARVEES